MRESVPLPGVESVTSVIVYQSVPVALRPPVTRIVVPSAYCTPHAPLTRVIVLAPESKTAVTVSAAPAANVPSIRFLDSASVVKLLVSDASSSPTTWTTKPEL